MYLYNTYVRIYVFMYIQYMHAYIHTCIHMHEATKGGNVADLCPYVCVYMYICMYMSLCRGKGNFSLPVCVYMRVAM